MEAIEQELSAKMIEKPKFETENLIEVKKKKPRTQAQKDAFEKARKKRAENIAKKKLADSSRQKVDPMAKPPKGSHPTDEVVSHPNPLSEPEPESADDRGQSQRTEATTQPILKETKGRGRPKGSRNKKIMKDLEPQPNPNYPQPVGHNPHPAVEHGLNYAPPPRGQYYNPYNVMPPNFQPPQVHNYYYGHQQGISTTKKTKTKKHNPPQIETPPTTSSESEEISSSSEEEYINEPELKYSYA